MKKIWINTTIIFLLASLFHFVYTFFPNVFTSLFFPVNESIIEHFKLLNTSSFIFSLFSFFITKENNFFAKAFLRTFFILFFLACLYLPVFAFFGESLIITLIILFISIFLSEWVLSKISWDKISGGSFFFFILLLFLFSMFIYFSYHPLKNNLFLDFSTNTYGLD